MPRIAEITADPNRQTPLARTAAVQREAGRAPVIQREGIRRSLRETPLGRPVYRGDMTIKSRRTTAEDVGYKVYNEDVLPGRLAKVFEQQAEILDQTEKNRRATQVSVAVAEASRELQQYAFDLQRGTRGQDGSVQAPPPPSEVSKLYAQREQELGDRYKEQLDGESFALFQERLAPIALRASLDVQGDSIARSQSEGVANLGKSIDLYAELAAEADDVSRPRIIEQAELAIFEAESRGLLKPGEGYQKREQFRELMTRAEIVRAMRESPDAAIEQLAGDTLPGLNPQEQQELLTQAVDNADRRRRDQLSEKAEAARLAREEIAVMKDRFATEVGIRKINGNLDESYLRQHIDLIPPDKIDDWFAEVRRDKTLELQLSEAAEQGQSVSGVVEDMVKQQRVDPAVGRDIVRTQYSRQRESDRLARIELEQAAANKTLSPSRINELYLDKRLSDDDWEKYSKAARGELAGVPDPIQAAKDGLTVIGGGFFGLGDKGREDLAKKEFDYIVAEFTERHGRKPDQLELDGITNELVKRQLDKDKTDLLPKYFEGNAETPDKASIQKAGQKLIEAHKNLQIGKFEFSRNVARLRQMNKMANHLAQKAPKSVKVN